MRAREAASCSRASALAIAWAASSANSPSRSSVSGGSASSLRRATAITPQACPATVIGAAIADCRLMLRSSGVRSFEFNAVASERAGRPERMASWVAEKRVIGAFSPTGTAGNSGGE